MIRCKHCQAIVVVAWETPTSGRGSCYMCNRVFHITVTEESELEAKSCEEVLTEARRILGVKEGEGLIEKCKEIMHGNANDSTGDIPDRNRRFR